MSKKNSAEPSYEEALQELQQIASAIELGEVGIDQLAAQTTRARYLLGWCEKK